MLFSSFFFGRLLSKFGVLIRFILMLILHVIGLSQKKNFMDFNTNEESDNFNSTYYLNLGVGLISFILILFVFYCVDLYLLK